MASGPHRRRGSVLCGARRSGPTDGLPVRVRFVDVNPCTGTLQTVTFTGTEFVHDHDGRVVGRGERTITTSDGFVGHGTHSFVGNGQVLMFRLADVLTNGSDDRIRASAVFILDLSTGTVRVDRGELTCLGP
jgi:hypothetical protein